MLYMYVSAFLYIIIAIVGEEELATKWWEMGTYVALDSLQTEGAIGGAAWGLSHTLLVFFHVVYSRHIHKH